jgi:PiT family inorganic phosphate transporter
VELQHLSEFEKAAEGGRGELVRFGVSFLFIVGVMFYAAVHGAGQGELVLVMAAIVAAYMAMNIGANDVANNVGPAVGAKALSLVGALAIAAVFDVAGALIAGERVIERMRSGIIQPELINDPQIFVWVMLAALLASAVWINVASALGAPVSTTHAIVGAIAGGGIAAHGVAIVNWPIMGRIVASWVVSPVLGGVLAAMLLYLIKRSITYHADMAAAARRVVPLLLAGMVWVFTTFLIVEGFSGLLAVTHGAAVLCGLVAGLITFLVVRLKVSNRGSQIANTKQAVNRLFTIPLMFAAAVMSFAHGSNDVANAVGPLAAIVHVVTQGGGLTPAATVPVWVMLVGALGISVGLALFGPRVIRTVGSEITELDHMRAFSVALASALTVILASILGLPVSSTHIVVGSVLGVGFLREYLKSSHALMVAEIKAHHPEGDQRAIDDFMLQFASASIDEKGELLKALKRQAKSGQDPARFAKWERKVLRKVYRHELVTRSQLKRIVAAWVVTVPASALMSAGLFHVIRGTLTP